MTQAATEEPSEIAALAGEMAHSFGRLVRSYEKHFAATREEAIESATEPPSDSQRVTNTPPESVNWCDLHLLARTDPDRAIAQWERIKQAALDELRSGHKAAKALESSNDGAWQRAQFMALRVELASDWKPRNGIERQLIDTLAQAQSEYLKWLKILTARTSLATLSDQELSERGKWETPRQSDADAIEQAADMMERFHRMFLRTLRAVCDLRRHDKPVIVQNGGQVNVANQQVNLSTLTPPNGI